MTEVDRPHDRNSCNARLNVSVPKRDTQQVLQRRLEGLERYIVRR